MRLLLETLDIGVSHSCARMCNAIAIVCACVGRDLYVSASGRFSFNDASWAISARVRVGKLPVLLITIGMISAYNRLFSVVGWHFFAVCRMCECCL